MSAPEAAGGDEMSGQPGVESELPGVAVWRRSYRRLRHAHALAAVQMALTTTCFVLGWYRWATDWPPGILLGSVWVVAFVLAAMGYAATDRLRQFGRSAIMVIGFVLGVAVAAVTLLPLLSDLTIWGFWPLFWLPSAAVLLTLTVATGRCMTVERVLTPPMPEEIASQQACLTALRQEQREKERQSERFRLEHPAAAARMDARREAQAAIAAVRGLRRIQRAQRWWPWLRHMTATSAVLLSGILGGLWWWVSAQRHIAVRSMALGLLATFALWALTWSYSYRPRRRRIAGGTAMVVQFCLAVFTLLGSVPAMWVGPMINDYRVHGGLFTVFGLTWLALAVGCYFALKMDDLRVHDPEAQAD